MHTRAYRDLNDLNGMMAVLSRGRQAAGGWHTIHTGDLSWWLFYHGDGKPLSEQITVWEDAGGIRAWVLYTPKEGTFDLFVDPDLMDSAVYADLHTACESEACTRICATGGSAISVSFVAETDLARQHLLTQHGYRLDEAQPGYVAFSQPLNALPEPAALADGAVVRPVSGEDELPARARPQYAAFRNTMPWDDYLARYRRFMHSPIYRREHDMGLVLPDGQFAAVCIYWTDPVTGVGHFEPVATHPDHQRRGYGRALLLAVMHRMRAEGMTVATVNTWANDAANIAFYQRCGFVVQRQLRTYKKALQ